MHIPVLIIHKAETFNTINLFYSATSPVWADCSQTIPECIRFQVLLVLSGKRLCLLWFGMILINLQDQNVVRSVSFYCIRV